MPPRVVILAGGKGTRLRPFTVSFPKPLVPLGDKPILEILLRRLAALGFRRVTLTVGHLASLIRAFIDQNKSLSALLDIDFVFEERATGTAGSLAQLEGLDEPFLVMNGDVLTDLDYRAMFAAHVRSGAMLTIASHRATTKSDFGVIESMHGIRFPEYFGEELASLAPLVADDLLVIGERAITVTPRGRLLVRAIAMRFDRRLREGPKGAQYSKVI